MFKKVLVVEDMDDINRGVKIALLELNISEIDQVQYCDDAYLRIKKAIKDQKPYDLLISDLSFKVDHREQKYPSGETLIRALQEVQPDLKVIMYSVEDRLQKVRTLINTCNIKSYVCKGRHGLKELSKAIHTVYNNVQYLSPQVAKALSDRSNLEIDDYDLELVKQLSFGLSQDEISSYFKEENISPNSLSSIEKHLNKLKIQFKANNATHLVATVKDLGLI
ncbi:DNA-binding response regulator [Aureibaculum luteum]|uniref:DNA-binding response regulator n=1 Tax=Aureibaculum luteum TaxID=1548456 RepID=UPI000E53C7AD|nr:response regulator transcription factor [Aureibaculum luteum]